MTTMPFGRLRLKDPGFANPRTKTGLDDRSIMELALHIGLHGLLNPPLVTQDGLVIAGQRRYRAIEFLIAWFSPQPMHVRVQGDEHPTFVKYFGEGGADLSHDEISKIERNTFELQRACPVRMVGGIGLSGLALADNILREQLSSFEIAQHLWHLHEDGATGAELARLIGKSKTYVSRRLAAWRGASTALRAAWEAGELTEEAVQEIAEMSPEEQERALAQPVPRGRRGPAHRPGIDTVKGAITSLERDLITSTTALMWPSEKVIYANAVFDTLRWVAGEQASHLFAELFGGEL